MLTSSPRIRPGAWARGRSMAAGLSGADPRHAGASRFVERLLQALEHAHDAHAALAVGDRRAALAHAGQEVLALQAQRLVVGHARRPDVPGAGDVLAVRVGLLV